MKIINDSTKQYYVVEASSKECGKLYELVRAFNLKNDESPHDLTPASEVLRAEQGNIAIIIKSHLSEEWEEVFRELVKSSSE